MVCKHAVVMTQQTELSCNLSRTRKTALGAVSLKKIPDVLSLPRFLLRKVLGNQLRHFKHIDHRFAAKYFL